MDRKMIAAGLLALLGACPACSVKEVRDDCPCYLHVAFTDPDAAGTADLLGWRDGVLFRQEVPLEDVDPEWVKPVGKGVLSFSACLGLDRSVLEGHRIGIPAGCQADSLYAYFEEVDATGDDAYVKVSLRKQFATVFLDIRKKPGETASFRFRVDGNTCGFDRLDFSPVAGLFHCEPEPREGESIVLFRLPRQQDDSLTVTVSSEGNAGLTFPLGEYIRRLGYNWKAEELQDIYVALDLVREAVEIRVAEWEQGMTFPLVEL